MNLYLSAKLWDLTITNYLLTDDKYWVFDGNEVIYNSPKSIHDYGLPQHVKKIDAIMVWDRNKKTYIFR